MSQGHHVPSAPAGSARNGHLREDSVEAEFVRYTGDEGIAVIVIDRPQAANAQNPQMLQELDEAWSLSDHDPQVRVVVLRSEGKHFSAGHDMQGGGDPSLGPQRIDW